MRRRETSEREDGVRDEGKVGRKRALPVEVDYGDRYRGSHDYYYSRFVFFLSLFLPPPQWIIYKRWCS
jgi:hypothetical protein